MNYGSRNKKYILVLIWSNILPKAMIKANVLKGNKPSFFRFIHLIVYGFSTWLILFLSSSSRLTALFNKMTNSFIRVWTHDLWIMRHALCHWAIESGWGKQLQKQFLNLLCYYSCTNSHSDLKTFGCVTNQSKC